MSLRKIRELDSFDEVADALSVPYMSYHYGTFKPNTHATIILCNPRSGSTLLSRLLNGACLTRCMGDKELSVFEGLLAMTPGLRKGTDFHDFMMGRGEHDMHDGCFSDNDRMKNLHRIWCHALFNDFNPNSRILKTALLGWGNELMVPFVKELEEVMGIENYNIVQLKRDPEEIADSFFTTPRSVLYGKEEERNNIISFVENQNDQMREVADFDTIQITYDDLINDTINTLMKIPTIHCEPDKEMVDKIIRKKIR